MAVETNAVQITINVTDGNSGAVVNQVTKNIESLGAAGATAGQKVAGAGQQGKKALDETGVAALSSVEKTRLLTEEFGVRLPRAMIRLAAQSKIVQATIGAIGTGLVALAAIQIGAMVFTQLVDGAKKLWNNYLSLDSAANKYREELEKQKAEDYWKSDSIETTTLRINEATQAASNFRSVSESLNSSGWRAVASGLLSGNMGVAGAGVGQVMGAYQMAGQAVTNQQNADKLTPERLAQQHEINRLQIEVNHAKDDELSKQKKITAERAKSLELAAEDRNFGNLKNGLLNPEHVDWKHGGEAEENLNIQKAQGAADSELFQLRKEQGQELAHMREAALEAGLRGSALYHAQEAAAIQDLKFKDMDSAAARDAIHLKFHNEEMKRLDDQQRETEKIERAASLAGASGIAKTQGEGANRVADLNADQTLDPEQRARRIAAVQKETNAQIADEQRTFSEEVDAIVERSQSRQISGFERIQMEAAKASNDLQKQFDKAHQMMDLNQPGAQAAYDQDSARLGIGLNAISAGAAGQTADLQRKNADETAQIEAEARAKLMSAEKNQTAAIETEYGERLHKFQEELAQQQISQEDYDRRVLAAGQMRDAELVESAQRAREKMAGEFTQFFKNPMQAMKEMGDKAAGEAAAALVQRMQNRVGSTGNTGQGGGIFDRIAGTATGRGASASGMATHSAASAMISVGTAQISIGGANVAFGGAGTSSPARGGGSTTALSSFSPSGGSTGLLASAGVASEPGGSTAAPMSFGGSTNAGSGAPGGGVGTAMGNAQQGMSLFSQGKSMLGGLFGGKKSTSDAGAGYAETESVDLSGSFNKAGNFNLGKSGTGMLNGGGVGANAMGAAGGAMGLYSAFEGNGGVGGALSGAMSGMQLGMALGGPIGAAIGAAGGAIIGAIGFGGKEKARVYDLKTVRPRITADTLSYQQGTMDYTSAYSDLQSLDAEARKTLKAMGGFGDRYYWDNVQPELKQAEGKLTAEQRAGRSNYTATAAQYDVGADSVPRDGFAMIHQNERILPSDQNERITRAIEAGAEGTRMAAQPQSGWGGDIHVHAIDAKSSIQWLMSNKHNVRAAMNASYAENSGGADA